MLVVRITCSVNHWFPPADCRGDKSQAPGPAKANMDTVSIPEAVETIEEIWSPRIVAEPNDQHVKVARMDGEFVWHAHPDADELFYVLEGVLDIEFRAESTRTLTDGDLLVVPAGKEHKPVAQEETTVLLVEPAGTRNTGDRTNSALTVEDPDQL